MTSEIEASENSLPLLIRVSGRDRPRLTRDLLGLVAAAGAELEDMEQLVVRERLTLDMLVRLDGASDALLRDILFWGFRHDMQIDFERVEAHSQRASLRRHAVTVLGQPLTPTALAAVSDAIADTGGNIDRIVRLATRPVTAYDLVVIAGDADAMRTALVGVAQQHGIDVAVQVNGLERRAKRLVVMDVDSTLIADEVIELLADEAGCRAEVEAVTAAAMAGELDFETSLRERVRRLAGLEVAAIDRAAARIRLTPGARTFVSTLQRMGFSVAVVSRWIHRLHRPAQGRAGAGPRARQHPRDHRRAADRRGGRTDRRSGPQGRAAGRDRCCGRDLTVADGGGGGRCERSRHARRVRAGDRVQCQAGRSGPRPHDRLGAAARRDLVHARCAGRRGRSRGLTGSCAGGQARWVG